jgi:hypothetical protein
MANELKNKKPYYAIKDCGHLKMTIKDVDTSSRTVCMVLNTYNYFDSQMDILMPGCAAKSIAEKGVGSSAPDKIQHALFHDLTQLPGKFKVLDERKVDGMDCIYAESKLADTTIGNDTMKNYLAEIYNQHSIGLRYVNAGWVGKDATEWESIMKYCINRDEAESNGQAFIVKEIKLFEGSTVAFGANALTPCLGMKSGNKDAILYDCISKIDKLNQTLKSGTQSDSMMGLFELQILQLKQVITDVFDQLTPKSDKETGKPDLSIGVNFDSLAHNFSLSK